MTARSFPTAQDAENAFYEALERGDLAAMVAVWAEADDVVCVHPRGPRLVGFDAVRQSWAQIFAGEDRRLESQFNLPAPVKLINEGCTEDGGKFADKSLGLWRVEDLRYL